MNGTLLSEAFATYSFGARDIADNEPSIGVDTHTGEPYATTVGISTIKCPHCENQVTVSPLSLIFGIDIDIETIITYIVYSAVLLFILYCVYNLGKTRALG